MKFCCKRDCEYLLNNERSTWKSADIVRRSIKYLAIVIAYWCDTNQDFHLSKPNLKQWVLCIVDLLLVSDLVYLFSLEWLHRTFRGDNHLEFHFNINNFNEEREVCWESIWVDRLISHTCFIIMFLPISLIDVNCCQHVIRLQEPETPWHLHVIRDFLITAWNAKITVNVNSLDGIISVYRTIKFNIKKCSSVINFPMLK